MTEPPAKRLRRDNGAASQDRPGKAPHDRRTDIRNGRDRHDERDGRSPRDPTRYRSRSRERKHDRRSDRRDRSYTPDRDVRRRRERSRSRDRRPPARGKRPKTVRCANLLTQIEDDRLRSRSPPHKGSDRRRTRTPPRAHPSKRPRSRSLPPRKDSRRSHSPPRPPTGSRAQQREPLSAKTSDPPPKPNGIASTTAHPVTPNGTQAMDLDSDPEIAEMRRLMGFAGFKSTKNTKVKGNNVYGVRKEKKTEYRQYMNRVGGFNRPLSPSR